MKEETEKKHVIINARETLTQKEHENLITGIHKIKGFNFMISINSKIES